MSATPPSQPSSLRPLSPEEATVLARQRFDQGQFEAAELILQAVLGQAPAHGPALSLLAALYLSRQRPVEAETLLRRALAHGPETAVLWCNLGTALVEQGQQEKALAAFESANRIDGRFALAHYNRGNLLRDLGRLEEAIAALRTAVELDPRHSNGWNNLGNLYLDCGNYSESIACYEQALAVDPAGATGLASRANLRNLTGDYQAAENDYRAALGRTQQAAGPTPATMHQDGIRFNLALNLFRQGRYEEAFPLYEHRWQGCPDLRGQYRYPPERQWRGEPLAGRRVLLWAEQGLGDSLQFLRFVPELAARAGSVTVVCQPALQRLFAASLPGIPVLARGQGPDTAAFLRDFDWHCPLMSLWLYLALPQSPSVAQVPTPIPYVQVPAGLTEDWAARLAAAEAALPGEPRRRVGLCWQSGKGSEQAARSVPLAAFAEVAWPGVRFVRLLKRESYRPEEAPPAAWQANGQWLDVADQLTDFADTAALVANLDAVLSVDTAVLHLAGALGRRVLAPFPCFGGNFFPQGRSDNPWYPSLQVVRQPTPGDWSSVIRQLRDLL